MNDDKPESATQIAEGLPPSLRVHAELGGPEICAAEPTVMEVLIAWEKLRLVYNAILIITVTWHAGPLIIVVAILAVEHAVVANLCFCLGHAAEVYLCWWGMNRMAARIAVLVVGTLIAIGSAVHYTQAMIDKLPAWP